MQRRSDQGARDGSYDQRKPKSHQRFSRRSRWIWLPVVVLMVYGLTFLASPRAEERRTGQSSTRKRGDAAQRVIAPLNGPPESFRSALLPELSYITAGHSYGNSNQILSILKLVYLSIVFDRVPILPSLSGDAHHEGAAIALSAFYNLTHLAHVLSKPILEWDHVQDPFIDLPPDLGCWRTVPRGGGEQSLRDQGVEPHFWPLPEEFTPPTFAKLQLFAQDEDARVVAIESEKERAAHASDGEDDSDAPTVEPDQHLLCFDQLLRTWEATFVNGEKNANEELQNLDRFGPTWLEVGQHLRWNDRLLQLADEMLRDALGSTSQAYIGVHLRQGDFIKQGKAQQGLIKPFVAAVKEVQAKLAEGERKRRRALPVVFATDSDDSAFLDSLKELGWVNLDHVRWGTVERWGGWYPAHLDLAILSGASAFVGTRFSSFSSLTARRVESWQGGPTVEVHAVERAPRTGVRKNGRPA